jgi:hypothetical protein
MRTESSRERTTTSIRLMHRRMAFVKRPWTIPEMLALVAQTDVPVTQCPSGLAHGVPVQYLHVGSVRRQNEVG